MRILSGIQPSGSLHIGNYFGMMQPMIESQSRGELFCFIANLHSLTSIFDGQQMARQTVEVAMDFLALGMDPVKSCFWVQSDVKEILELTWYLSNVTPVGLLQRCHAYKDKVDKGIAANNGLFTYPVLMAADILAFHSNVVPVGQDQKQHVEVARDVAIRFNNVYGDIFTIPEPEIRNEVAVVPGLDGQKMSKSYGNTIEIFAPEKEVRKKIMRIVTNSTPVQQPKDPDKDNVFRLYRLFSSQQETEDMAQRYRNGGYGYGEAKKALADKVTDYFAPYRAKREDLARHPDDVRDILRKGAERARQIAVATTEKVRQAVGMNY